MVLLGLVLAGILLAYLAYASLRAGNSPRAAPAAPPVRLKSKNWCDFEVVGESHYMVELTEICEAFSGPDHHCEAILRPDPTNPYDPNAVVVTIDGRTVGHLARDQAAAFKTRMKELGLTGRSASCRAYVGGREGAQRIGVWLGLSWPADIEPGA